MAKLLKLVGAATVALVLATNAFASPIDTYQFKSEANEQRAVSLATSLRCPQCQNQNLVDSNSPVARDLRLEVYKMVDGGKSDADIIKFMTSRYGEFVLYMPRVETKTYILWGGPIALFVIGLLVVVFFVRRQRGDVTKPVQLSEDDQRQLDELLKRDKQ
ncbi:heme lyase NrfEFG subunit NrfF [Shewanella sp. NFH-SH190041]|uniref:heme lyase NrfEFG subunit NrfF n=1 Tax=Shewanella sp. NFH-SH190041 TaxID=2950245 RepID=UPI0021C4B34E|nr:heme lyase NrfEFG subunit NrfF [Shewanella sp. NFH-SH190041]